MKKKKTKKNVKESRRQSLLGNNPQHKKRELSDRLVVWYQLTVRVYLFICACVYVRDPELHVCRR